MTATASAGPEPATQAKPNGNGHPRPSIDYFVSFSTQVGHGHTVASMRYPITTPAGIQALQAALVRAGVPNPTIVNYIRLKPAPVSTEFIVNILRAMDRDLTAFFASDDGTDDFPDASYLLESIQKRLSAIIESVTR